MENGSVINWKRGPEAQKFHTGQLNFEVTTPAEKKKRRKSVGHNIYNKLDDIIQNRTPQLTRSTSVMRPKSNPDSNTLNLIQRNSSPKIPSRPPPRPPPRIPTRGTSKDQIPTRTVLLKKTVSDKNPLLLARSAPSLPSSTPLSGSNLYKLRNQPVISKSESSNKMSRHLFEKRLKDESDLLKRIEELKLKEKELLDSISQLTPKSYSFTSSKLMRKKSKDIKKVNIKEISVCERLGSGFSGAVVYSCIVDGWVCAMKQLSSENKVDLESFEREMTILYQLPPHPNIVKYLFHSTLNGKLCLFMTKHHGTLQQLIHTKEKTKEYFPQLEICKIAGKIINGIEFLHSNRIIHRDIKTENIYYTPDSTGELKEVVLADFDTARHAGVANVPQSTIGTMGYMAPEVFNNKNTGTGYTFSADVFSFGMVLYSLITLQEPYYYITNPFQIYKTILEGNLPTIDEEPASLYSDELIQLHRDCILLNPLHRPKPEDIFEIFSALVHNADT